MKIAVASFQSFVSESNHIAGASDILSERRPFKSYGNVLEHSDSHLIIRAVLQREAPNSIDRELPKMFQQASAEVLPQVLDHAHRRCADIIIVRGLALFAPGLEIIARFSVDLTVICAITRTLQNLGNTFYSVSYVRA